MPSKKPKWSSPPSSASARCSLMTVTAPSAPTVFKAMRATSSFSASTA
jgi:hypothetical protein